MYFSFTAFSADYYFWPGLIGLVVFIVQRIFHKDHDEDLVIVMNALFTVIFCGWCTFFLEMWNRKQCVNAVHWGQDDQKTDVVTRPEFKGKDRRSPVTDEMEAVYYSTFRRKRFQVFGYLLSLSLAIVAASVVAGIIILRWLITDDLIYFGIDIAGPLCGLINACSILVFN